ncbi:MAG TPA: hypothetical protein VFU05_09745 [Cyclobacteriaceae bacterium]|nr:hypothetical protein [Cyclobacteriaceae bacterium]
MSTKKILLLAYVGSIIALAACSSGKSAFEHGNYYEAVITSVNRLRKNDDHKKSIETLRQAYPMAVTFYEDRAKTSLASNNEFKWTAVVESYATINVMYDEIRRCPGALKVIPNPVNYYSKLEEAKKNAAEENYAAGILALQAGTRDKAKIAYGLFIKANGFVPGYKDVVKMTETALWNATVKVVMEPIPVAAANIKVSADFFNDKVSEYLHTASINQFVKFYTRKEAQTLKLNPDHVVKIEFDEFTVGQVFMNEKEYKLEKDSVVAGTYVSNSGAKATNPPSGAGAIVAGGTTGVVAGNQGNTGNTQTNTGNTQANTGNSQANTGNTQTNTGNTQANTGNTQTNTGNTQTNTGNTQANTGNTQTNTGNTQANTGNTQTNTGNTQANTGNTQANTGNTQANTGNTQTNTGNTQANTGNTQANTGNTQANTGNTQTNSGNSGNSGNSNSQNNSGGNAGNSGNNAGSNTPEDTTKVTICHVPPGNAAARHTLVINRSALKGHLGHGDTEGACPEDAKPKDDKKPNDNKGGNSKKQGNTSASTRGPVFFASADNDPMKWLAYSEAAETDTTKIYMTVKATYYYYKKTTTSKGILSFKIIDAKTNAILSVEKMPGEYVWVSEWATFNGDERALSAEQLRITKQKEQAPPPAQDLFIGFTKPIYDQLVTKIQAFYKGY